MQHFGTWPYSVTTKVLTSTMSRSGVLQLQARAAGLQGKAGAMQNSRGSSQPKQAAHAGPHSHKGKAAQHKPRAVYNKAASAAAGGLGLKWHEARQH